MKKYIIIIVIAVVIVGLSNLVSRWQKADDPVEVPVGAIQFEEEIISTPSDIIPIMVM